MIYLVEVTTWRQISDRDLVVEGFRIRNPYGEGQKYGDPDRTIEDDMTDAMVEAAKALLAVVRAEFPVWSCDEVDRFEVDVSAWRETGE